jgi:hypothetical protein
VLRRGPGGGNMSGKLSIASVATSGAPANGAELVARARRPDARRTALRGIRVQGHEHRPPRPHAGSRRLRPRPARAHDAPGQPRNRRGDVARDRRPLFRRVIRSGRSRVGGEPALAAGLPGRRRGPARPTDQREGRRLRAARPGALPDDRVGPIRHHGRQA